MSAPPGSWLLWVSVLLATLLAAVPVAADTAARVEIEAIDESRYPEVRLEITLHGDVGAVPAETAFTVTEGGEARSATVTPLSSRQLRTVLLVDTSGSMSGEPIAAARAAAGTFVDRLPAQTEIAVVGFGREAVVLSPFSSERAAATTAVAYLVAGGETALYDGVVTALAQFGPDDGEAERSIVLLSDGGDTVSEATLEAVVAALEGADVRLYAIELRTTESDPAALAALASASDGRVVPVSDVSGFDAVFASIASELANHYEIHYRSEARGVTRVRVEFRSADVVVAGEREVAFPSPSPSPSAVVPPSASMRSGDVATVSTLWSNPWVMVGGGVAVFVGLLIVTYVLLAVREPRRRLAAEVGAARPRRTGMTGLAEHAAAAAERQLQRHGWTTALNSALERAGLDLRPGEYVVLTASAATTAFGLGLLLANSLLGGVLAIGTVLLARIVLKVLVSRRQSRFGNQLGDVLQLLAGSLRAGYGFMQAVDAVAREADQPAADEFGRLVIESRVGRDAVQSLQAMAHRVGSEDFAWVIQAIDIHREVGGDLAEVLDTVAETIRQRNQIRRQIKALSAEGRYSAYVLLALPPGVAFIISLTNPGYLSALTGSLPGLLMLSTAVVLVAVGALWLRKLTRLVF